MGLGGLGGDDDVGPVPGGLQGDGFADPPAGPGDEERAARQLPERDAGS